MPSCIQGPQKGVSFRADAPVAPSLQVNVGQRAAWQRADDEGAENWQLRDDKVGFRNKCVKLWLDDNRKIPEMAACVTCLRSAPSPLHSREPGECAFPPPKP